MAETDPESRPADRRIRVVDTHHHLWDLGQFRYDWLSEGGRDDVTDVLGDYADIRRDYLVDQLIADYRTAGVVKSVHVQADISEHDPVVETSWLQSIADEHGFPHAIVAYADLRSPNVDGLLDRHLLHANMRGVRMPDDDESMADPALQRGAAALAQRGLSLQLDTPPSRMRPLADLAAAHPSLRIFLGHTGLPEARDASYFSEWRRALKAVARADNVAMKISGLGMGDHNWTIDSIRPWVLEAINAFGTERCVFGTNWPVDSLYGDLTTLLDAYRFLLSEFSPNEQAALLAGNAERLYRI